MEHRLATAEAQADRTHELAARLATAEQRLAAAERQAERVPELAPRVAALEKGGDRLWQVWLAVIAAAVAAAAAVLKR